MKMISGLFRNLFFLLFAGSFFVMAAEGAEGNAIGKVIAVEGQVEAGERALARGASIYVSDVINVAAASKIQIKFTDGGILNLIESTQYRIDSYQLNKGGKSDYSAELVEGGFRAVSGSIGKNESDNYAVKTPVATIGIRGTLFEANIEEGETFFGCDQGHIAVSNSAGERVLGAGQFVSATSFDQLGEVSHIRPPALRPERFANPKGGASVQKAPKVSPQRANPKNEPTKAAPRAKETPESEIHELHVPAHVGNPRC